MMLHTKYQCSRPCGFRQEECFMFYHISLCKTYDTGRVHFWPQGHDLSKLGRGPRGDGYISNIKTLGNMVSDKKIFSCFINIQES